MTVAELITYLQTQPQDLLVAYNLHSEQALMEVDQIGVVELSLPRADGWVHNKRSDKSTQQYLLFPGN